MSNKDREMTYLPTKSRTYKVLDTKSLGYWFEDVLEEKKKQDGILSFSDFRTYTKGYLNYRLVLPPRELYERCNQEIFIETRNEEITFQPNKDFYLRIYFSAKSINNTYTEYCFMDFFNALAVYGQPNTKLIGRPSKDGDDRDPYLVYLVKLLAKEFGIKGFGFNQHQLSNDGVKFDRERFMAGELH